MEDKIIEKLPVVDVVETDDVREPRRYEIGYLLSPIIAPENVSATVETLIRRTILAAGGQVIFDEAPKLIPLAYSIRQTVENKNLRFQEAYFSSLRFLVAPEKIAELDRTFRFSPPVLRFLIVELPTQVEEPRRRVKEDAPPSEGSAGSSKGGGPAGVEMSQADMDREIEELLAPALQL